MAKAAPTTTLHLSANGPYDLARSYSRIVCAVVASRHRALGIRALPMEEGEFRVALRVDGHPILVGLRQEQPSAEVQVRPLLGSLSAN